MGTHPIFESDFDCLTEMTSSEEKASAEISSIIRSSIKKKLIEMGEEIDDELPDYILLMIANRKTRSQINSELKLFLGDSAANALCSWLFKILDKLSEKRSKFEGKSAIKDEPVDAEEVEYWRGKYESERRITMKQKNEIDRLKKEILDLKLAKERSKSRRSSVNTEKLEENLYNNLETA